MGADDGADSPVKIPAHGYFFAGRFRVHIDNYYRSFLSDLIHFLLGPDKRTVYRFHKHTAKKVDDSDFSAASGIHNR